MMRRGLAHFRLTLSKFSVGRKATYFPKIKFRVMRRSVAERQRIWARRS